MALPQEDLEHFLRRGYLILPSAGCSSVHEGIFSKAAEIVSRGPHAAAMLGDNVLPAIPELHEVLESPSVQKALTAVLGKDYLLHGHRHLHLSTSREQQWHKDSYWGFRKLRHHRPRWCMLLYYPQDTTIDMGPTHVLAGTQYWTVDTERRLRAGGEDILWASDGLIDMFVDGACGDERSVKLREAEQIFLGPEHGHLAEDVALTVPAGSCVLMHYDLFHRAGFWVPGERQRFMFKFQFLRTKEPTPWEGTSASWAPPSSETWRCDWPSTQSSPSALPAPSASPRDMALGEQLKPVLQDIRGWLQGQNLLELEEADSPMPRAVSDDKEEMGQEDAAWSEKEHSDDLVQANLLLKALAGGEPELTARAYELGASGEWRSLLVGLLDPREAVARSSAYGLVAAGLKATAAVAPYLQSPCPRVRMLASFILGESALPTAELLNMFETALRDETLQVVEASILQSLSCLASRARAIGLPDLCEHCMDLAFPFLAPVQNGYSLAGENACLVVLLAAGATGDAPRHILEALHNILLHCHDQYMAWFAREVLRRHLLALKTAAEDTLPPFDGEFTCEEKSRCTPVVQAEPVVLTG